MAIHHVAILVLLTLAVTACGANSDSIPDAETETPSIEPTAEDGPQSPAVTPSPVLSPQMESPVATPAEGSEGPAQAIEAAKERVASKSDISTEEVEVVSVEPVEWSDASLGCPKPGHAYAQVITPGYRIKLRAGDRVHEVHTDRSGRAAVLCERKPEPGPAAAVDTVAEKLDVPRDEIEILTVEAVEWPDASLGCPGQGKSYAQVITPGYRVILKAGDKEIEVHTDRAGRNVVICGSAR